MSDKNSRAGGKYTSNHTTLIPFAANICDIAHQSKHVTRINPGFIKAGLRPSPRRIKMSKKDGFILLSIKDSTTHQEVYLYVDNTKEATKEIYKRCRSKGWNIILGSE